VSDLEVLDSLISIDFIGRVDYRWNLSRIHNINFRLDRLFFKAVLPIPKGIENRRQLIELARGTPCNNKSTVTAEVNLLGLNMKGIYDGLVAESVALLPAIEGESLDENLHRVMECGVDIAKKVEKLTFHQALGVTKLRNAQLFTQQTLTLVGAAAPTVQQQLQLAGSSTSSSSARSTPSASAVLEVGQHDRIDFLRDSVRIKSAFLENAFLKGNSTEGYTVLVDQAYKRHRTELKQLTAADENEDDDEDSSF